MLVIRLRRTGSKKRPYYRIVVADSAKAREGRFVEVIGDYNPRQQPAAVKLDYARAEHWLRAGAVPSATVRSLIERAPKPEAPATTPTEQ